MASAANGVGAGAGAGAGSRGVPKQGTGASVGKKAKRSVRFGVPGRTATLSGVASKNDKATRQKKHTISFKAKGIDVSVAESNHKTYYDNQTVVTEYFKDVLPKGCDKFSANASGDDIDGAYKSLQAGMGDAGVEVPTYTNDARPALSKKASKFITKTGQDVGSEDLNPHMRNMLSFYAKYKRLSGASVEELLSGGFSYDSICGENNKFKGSDVVAVEWLQNKFANANQPEIYNLGNIHLLDLLSETGNFNQESFNLVIQNAEKRRILLSLEKFQVKLHKDFNGDRFKYNYSRGRMVATSEHKKFKKSIKTFVVQSTKSILGATLGNKNTYVKLKSNLVEHAKDNFTGPKVQRFFLSTALAWIASCFKSKSADRMGRYNTSMLTGATATNRAISTKGWVDSSILGGAAGAGAA